MEDQAGESRVEVEGIGSNRWVFTWRVDPGEEKKAVL